jgi:hypothetical protein
MTREITRASMIYNTPEKLEFSSIVEERRSNLVYDVIVVHLPTQIEKAQSCPLTSNAKITTQDFHV